MEESAAAIAFYAINEDKYDCLTCTYTHCGYTVRDVPVNLGRSTLVEDNGAGARIENASNDFIIPARYLWDVDAFKPEKGDTVTITHPGGGRVYQLMTPPYSPHDHAGEFFRLHTELLQSY